MKALKLLPQAQALYKSGDFQGAIQIYDQILALGLNQELLWGVYELRGDAYHRLKNFDASISDYSTAILMGAQDGKVKNNLCWDYTITGHPDLGLLYCNQAVLIEPANFHFLDSRGFTYARLGNFPAAIADFQQTADILANTQVPGYQKLRDQRLDWIKALKSGADPFTPEVLDQLTNE